MAPSTPAHLAFDLGASSGRAMVGRVDGTQLDVEEVYRFETPLIEDGERLYWDLKTLEREIWTGLQRGLNATPDFRSVSVDSWAVDYVPLDEEGQPLRNPRCYRDPRTEEVMDQALKQVSPKSIYDTTGIQFLPLNTLYQVLADQRDEPDLVAQTALRLPIADYLLYRFSGRPVVERTMASTTQLVDARSQTWATELMSTFDIDPATWPEIVPPATKLGPIAVENAPFRVPEPDSPVEVISGCSHDTACAVAAVPAEEDGRTWAYISCGTWSLLGVEQSAPLLTDAAREAGFTNEMGLDDTYRFLTNLTGLWVLQECERVWEEEGQTLDYESLQRAAADARSLPPVDLEEPRFRKRGQMPEKLRRYCREHDQPEPESRGEFVRLILESLAVDYRENLETVEELTGTEIDTVHLVGGGARNELLCQWTADATERSVVAGPAEATALGNLLVQACTMDTLPRGRTIREVVRASVELQTYTPARTASKGRNE